MKKIIFLAIFLLGQAMIFAADMERIIKDSQIARFGEGDKKYFVWWIPTSYWKASLENKVPADQLAKMLGKIGEYNLVAFCEYNINSLAAFEFTDPKTISENLKIKVSDKELIAPLDSLKIDAGVLNLINMIKPILANGMGQFGSGIIIAVFPQKDSSGATIASETQKGSLTVVYKNETFFWKLPLPCFLPDKVDVVTKERFPGNYEFNPYTGSKLEEIKN